jgi:hypothetical protein
MLKFLSPVALSLLLLLAAAPALASHYFLDDVDIFDEDLEAMFIEQGMRDTRDVLARLQEVEGRQVLSRSTGFDEARLLEAAILLELVQLDGVGPRAGRLLRAAGVEGAIDLASRQAPELLVALEQANDGFVHTSVHPSLEHVQSWIYVASQAEVVVAR